MTTPSVSIVIPCYNAERFVGQAIQSALDQGPDVEVIVIDDGSTDGSVDVIRSFGDRIVWRTGANRGACAARNTGLDLAHAERVCFLDSDDFYDPGFVRSMLEGSAADTIDVTLGRHRSERSARHSPYFSSLRAGASRNEIFRAWSECRAAQTSAIVWRRTFLMQIGGWRESLLQAQDIEIGCRAMLLGARAQAVDVGYAVYRGTSTDTKITKTINELFLQSQVDAARNLSTLALKQNQFDQECIGRFAYVIARKAFRHGHGALGLDALRLARRLGFSGNFGSTPHVLGATLLGLPLKEKLAVRLRPPVSLVRARSHP